MRCPWLPWRVPLGRLYRPLCWQRGRNWWVAQYWRRMHVHSMQCSICRLLHIATVECGLGAMQFNAGAEWLLVSVCQLAQPKTWSLLSIVCDALWLGLQQSPASAKRRWMTVRLTQSRSMMNRLNVWLFSARQHNAICYMLYAIARSSVRPSALIHPCDRLQTDGRSPSVCLQSITRVDDRVEI